jgi:protein-disulfide isomerase
LRALALVVLLLTASSAEAETVRVQRIEEQDAPARGPRYAPVTIEFFCGGSYYLVCQRHHLTLTELAKRHPRRLRVVYRQYDRSARDGNAFAEAAHEAWRQARFFPFIDALYATGRVGQKKDLERIARQAGMDLDALRAALADGRHRPRLEADDVWAARLGLEGTGPILVWNGRMIRPRGSSIDEFEELYDAAYAEARKLLVEEGVPLRRVYGVLLRRAAREQAELAGAAFKRPGRGPFAEKTIDLTAPRANVPQDGAPARGEPSSEVTLVVFSDFQCHYCFQIQRTLRRLEDAYPGRLRIVYKHFPMSVHPDARLAAEAAACAHDQGKFWAFHDKLFTEFGRLKRPDLVRHAGDVGLDVDQFLEDLEAGRCSDRVKQDVADGRALGVEQTPTIFVNGLRIAGNRSPADLRALLDEELRPGLLESVTTVP